MDEDRSDSIESSDTQDASACKLASQAMAGKFARFHSTPVVIVLHAFALLESEDELDEPWVQEKKLDIVAALKADPVDISLLRELAVTNGGFLCNSLRRKVWPKLLGVNPHRVKKYAGRVSYFRCAAGYDRKPV